MSGHSFFEKARNAIKLIPRGKVATYGQIAILAGNERAARQIGWLLHSTSEKDHLPWHRVINAKGFISLKPGYGYEEQRELLQHEGVKFDEDDRINLEVYLWQPYNLRPRKKNLTQ
jgi:methylated-DNA-protein-cysteine methyltransferase-like protein